MQEKREGNPFIPEKDQTKIKKGLFAGKISIALGYLSDIRSTGVTLKVYHETSMSKLEKGADYEVYSKMHTSVYDFLKKNAKFFKIKVGED